MLESLRSRAHIVTRRLWDGLCFLSAFASGKNAAVRGSAVLSAHLPLELSLVGELALHHIDADLREVNAGDVLISIEVHRDR